jgi:hypothetical protein
MASSFVCEGIDLDGSTASGCRTCRRGSSPAGSPRPRVIGWNGAGGCAIFSQARQENLSRTVWTTFHWRGITLALDVPAELDQFAAAIRTRARRRDHYPLARQISRKGAAGRRAAFNTLDRPTPGAASQRRPRPLTHPLARPASSSSSWSSNGSVHHRFAGSEFAMSELLLRARILDPYQSIGDLPFRFEKRLKRLAKVATMPKNGCSSRGSHDDDRGVVPAAPEVAKKDAGDQRRMA